MMRYFAVLALLAVAAAPPAQPTPEQEEALRVQDGLIRKALAVEKADRAAAIAAMEKALAINGEVHGPWHRAAEVMHRYLAVRRQAGREWGRVIGHRLQVVAVRERLLGAGHWQTVSARWDLRTARLRAG